MSHLKQHRAVDYCLTENSLRVFPQPGNPPRLQSKLHELPPIRHYQPWIFTMDIIISYLSNYDNCLSLSSPCPSCTLTAQARSNMAALWVLMSGQLTPPLWRTLVKVFLQSMRSKYWTHKHIITGMNYSVIAFVFLSTLFFFSCIFFWQSRFDWSDFDTHWPLWANGLCLLFCSLTHQD